MARTALTIVTDCARFLGVIGATESLSPEDANYGYRVLNDYLAGLNAKGGFYAGGELTGSSPVPLPDELMGALVKAMALELAPGFDIDLGRKEREAMQADRTIINATARVPIIQPEGVMRNTTARNYGRG